MRRFNRLALVILGLPKTLFFNFRYLKFKEAIKLPFLISHRVKLMSTKGTVKLSVPAKFGVVKIGFGDVTIFDSARSRTIWRVTKNANVVFGGKADIGHGSKLTIHGDLSFGKEFAITAESSIVCYKKITFGDGVLVSWENLFMDSDFHKINDLESNKRLNNDKAITIGNHVWFGCRCTILKGAVVGDNNVIAAGTILSNSLNGNHSYSIIGGTPAKVLREKVTWAI